MRRFLDRLTGQHVKCKSLPFKGHSYSSDFQQVPLKIFEASWVHDRSSHSMCQNQTLTLTTLSYRSTAPFLPQDDLLLEACERGEASLILELLQQPADGGPPAAANAQQRASRGAGGAGRGRSALHLAVQSASVEAVEILLERGANVSWMGFKDMVFKFFLDFCGADFFGNGNFFGM